MEGDDLIVGAPTSNAAGAEAGELDVFTSGDPPVLQQILLGSDIAAGDHFGGSAAISGDLIVVGADRHAHGLQWAGAAYVYRRIAGTWVEEAELLASDRSAFDTFGSGVGVWGERIVVGAPLCDTDAGADRGAVYVFERVAGAWTEVYKGVASDGASIGMGWRVALDGDRLLAVAPASVPSAVYAFLRTPTGWAPDAKFTAPLPGDDSSFGRSADVNGDVVAIGYPNEAGVGSVHVFRFVAGAWNAEAVLRALYGQSSDEFGSGVAVQGDRMVIGSRGESAWKQASGAGYFFERIGGVWEERIELVPRSGVPEGHVGIPVALDGGRAAIGAADPANSVYLFDLDPLVGTAFCAGDGSGSPCPCANESDAGLGLGCANGMGWGAALAATGSTSVASDDLVFSVAHAAQSMGLPQHGVPVLLLAGTTQVGGGSGVAFGDGLRCVETNALRLGVRFCAPFGGLVVYDPGMSSLGGWGAGDTRFFQAWYRSPVGSPCGSKYNSTNALEVLFEP